MESGNKNQMVIDREHLMKLLGTIPQEKFKTMQMDEIIYLVYDSTYLKYFQLWKMEEENARVAEQGTIRLTEENLKITKVMSNVVYCLENYENVEPKIRETILKGAKDFTQRIGGTEEDTQDSDYDPEC